MRRSIREALASAGDRGASAVEYGLMVAAIAAVIVAVVFGLGGLIKTTYQDTCAQIEAQNSETVNDSATC